MKNLSLFFSKWNKRLRIFFRLLLHKLNIDKRPVFAVLTVTSQCNYSCSYCFSDYHKKANIALSTENILKIIDELHQYGVIYLNVHGGEALLRQDIGIIIEHALSKKMFVNLITNGVLLKKKWEQVKKVNSICISLDGREENNDKNRKKGSFKSAVEAIDFVLAQAIPVRIGMTITRHTQHDLHYIAEFAKTRKIFIQPFLLFDQENLPQDIRMTSRENKVALESLIKLKKEGYPIFYSLETLEYAYNWPFEQEHLKKSDLNNTILQSNFPFRECYYKKLNILVENDGSIRACNARARKGLHISLSNNFIKDAKEALLKQDDCLYCYHLPKNEFGNLMSLRLPTLMGQFSHQLKEDIRSIYGRPKRKL
ncbi:MAG: radical SAM protein [Oligoflexia bacterium]|nr:radical SAM protein [Oligoflexia bacterium]